MSSKIVILEEEDKEISNRLAAHPCQSWEWGEFRKLQGHQVIRIGKEENGKLKEVFQISFHPIPLISLTSPTFLTIGYLPKSSLPSPEVLEKLKGIGKEEKAIFIKVEPNVENFQFPISNFQFPGLIKSKSLFAKYTSVIDLTRSEKEIFESFKPKTRYNIRLSEKHGVKIQEDNSNEAFKKHLQLTFETTKRQGFYAHNESFHRLQWQVLKPAGISHLLTATYHGRILATFLLFTFNNVLYYPYGASTREYKELMAPTLLMWEAIKFGKKVGCKNFDLWGDLEPNPSPNHPSFGYHRFKEGFSPKLVEFVGSYDLVINPALYHIYKIADKIRWGVLKFRKNLKF